MIAVHADPGLVSCAVKAPDGLVAISDVATDVLMTDPFDALICYFIFWWMISQLRRWERHAK